MGAKNSKGQVKFKHFYFDEVLKRQSYGKQLITITRPIMNEAQYRDWMNIYEEAKDMNKDSLFLPEQTEHRKIKGYNINCCCGAESQVDLTFENFDYLLHSELLNRSNKGTFFSESQLLFLYYKLLEGSKEFQVKSKSLGDIRPKNILYTKSGDIKMINLASFPWERTSLDKILDGYDNKTVFFLAPEEAKSLTSAGGRSHLPNAKTEAWSVGLTLLEAATLQQSQKIYQMPSRGIHANILEQRLRKVQKKYPLLHQYLTKALEMDSHKRESSGQIWARLKCYSERITQLQSFSPNSAKQADAIQRFHRQASIN